MLRTGTLAQYRAVAVVAGEPHSVRDDLVGRAAAATLPVRGRALAGFAHVTDLQLADIQSPARFEFFNREIGDPRFALLVPTQRPQESLNAHAAEAMLRTLNRLALGPLGGRPLELVVTSGDAIDNAQWNELDAFLALLEGGTVRMRSGGAGYEGVQSPTWPDGIFWQPDAPEPGIDVFRLGYGFPHLPGLLERALHEFEADGSNLPWLGCHGNHETLNQGVAAITPELAEALVGGAKPLRLPEPLDRDHAVETFTTAPHRFLAGPQARVTPDPDRRPISRRDFVEAHLRAGARPHGHGFTPENKLRGTAYYTYDTPAIRFIALDTACSAGGAEGCLDREQLRWLEERLVEVHSSFRAEDGETRQTPNADRLVVLNSHHGADKLTNRRCLGPDGEPHAGGAELTELLLRFPNVVLWLNGHTHRNQVAARRDPARPGGGFWEVTTCSVVDWPCQARLVELIDAGEGMLVIACTMVDHESPLGPGPAMGLPDLAALHRQLAGNMPWAGFDSPRIGTPADRNVVLPVRAPFPIGPKGQD